MNKQVQMVKEVPSIERVRMLGIRITPEEQHRMRLAAVIARESISDFVRGRMADVLAPVINGGEKAKVEKISHEEGIAATARE